MDTRVEDWDQYVGGGAIVRAKQYDAPFSIQTPRGPEHGDPGEWCIVAWTGEAHICGPRTFGEVYRPWVTGGDDHERTS